MDVHGNSSLTPNLNHLTLDLTSEVLFKLIATLTPIKHFWVGYSGGLDSHVLLDLAVRTFANRPEYQIGAIHIHDGLSPNADKWVDHCQSMCAQYQIPIRVRWVDAQVKEGESPEEISREVRYGAFAELVKPEEGLLLAHHAEDQAETILLRLFRGAGPLGLSGMSHTSRVNGITLIRPFLNVSKSELEGYAAANHLNWVLDETNQNVRFDRNFLRHEIIPKLKARWPRVVRSVGRAGALCLETSTAVQVIAAQDYQTVMGTRQDRLSVLALLNLEIARRKGVIRYWLQLQQKALPSRDHLERIDREVLQAKAGAKPQLKIDNYVIKRRRNELLVETF